MTQEEDGRGEGQQLTSRYIGTSTEHTCTVYSFGRSELPGPRGATGGGAQVPLEGPNLIGRLFLQRGTFLSSFLLTRCVRRRFDPHTFSFLGNG